MEKSMESRCQVCYQPATKKCTSCGRVFCDLHVRYGGQMGGPYGGGSVGYYCDECWETKMVRRKRTVGVLLAVGLVLLATNLLGLFVLRRTGSLDVPWSPIAVIVGILLLVSLLAAVMLRRSR